MEKIENPFELILNRIDELEQLILSVRNKEDDDKLISPAQACQLFEPKISKPTLKKLSDEGTIVMHRLGGRTWYKKSDILNANTNTKKYKRKLSAVLK